jgi:arylsulfatase A-like enzyme
MADTDSHPNVVLFFTDQQRYDTINAAGYPHMITPNLDRLVKEGCNFANAYSPNPICVPARHNLLTGLPARYHGFASNTTTPMDSGIPTLPRLLSDHGYDTRAIGKMHFQPPRRHHGFDRMEIMEETPATREEDDYLMYLEQVGLGHVQNIHGVRNLLYMVPQRAIVPEEHHGSTWVADRSIDYIRRHAGRRPFFLWSSWIQPHPPWNVSDAYADLYRDANLPEPIESRTPLNIFARRSGGMCDIPKGKEAAYIRRIRELYAAAVTQVDHNVGRILAALEETDQLDNTLILFASDHGEMLGDFGCWQKNKPYDSSSKVPLVMRYPAKVEAGSVRADFVSVNDILPTVLDVAGIDYPGPAELPGGSLFRDDRDRSRIYIESLSGVGRWVAVCEERYKFVYHYAGAEEELFDRQEDPAECVNLLHGSPSADAQAARDRLRAELLEYERRWGLVNYVHHDDFLCFPKPPETGRISRNNQFPRFPVNAVRTAEREAFGDLGDEVIAAVKDEPLVKLHELDLDSWQQNGAPKSVIERIRREKL